jgi:aminoglycoside phosphotransferase (APT) family kinase protein
MVRYVDRPAAAMLDLVTALWPDVDVASATVRRERSHDVVIVPGRMAVRIARTPAADADLHRSLPVLAALTSAELPFAVPEPLSPIVYHRGMTALATTIVPGIPRRRPARYPVDPAMVRDVLDAVAGIRIDLIAASLSGPWESAGGAEWADAAARYLMPRLSPVHAELVDRRIRAVQDLGTLLRPRLVHGGLTAPNLHWDGDRIIGVLGWGRSFAGDPAYDTAYLANLVGWDVMRAAVDDDVAVRAGRYSDVFLVESYLTALRDGHVDDAGRALSLLQRQLDYWIRTVAQAQDNKSKAPEPEYTRPETGGLRAT